MLLGKQIRAIRAMEDITREAFCDLSGISLTALDNVDRGQSYQKKTESRIMRTIESLGYKLTEKGVEETKREVIWLDAYNDLLIDIRLHAKKNVLFLNADDRKSSQEVNDETALLITRFDCKFLCPANADLFIFKEQAKYKTSSEIGARDVSVIYGDRVGLYTPDGIMVIVNKWIAEDYKEQFKMLWSKANDI